MSNLVLICFILGVIILVVRLPFVIAPKKAVKVYQYVNETNLRTRIIVIAGMILWSTAIYFAQNSNAPHSQILVSFGIIADIIFIFLLIFTKGFRSWADKIMNSMSENQGALRVISLIPAAIGVLLVYLSIMVF